ncbi:MAG: thiosulfate oxidation carrier complex protein SoxZ [Piscirickettsiaceae bacterium]|jgi:sulfur-oxidizing protein SoxZ|nr:thiosulfate oxidation carrier complex protein SoxZ [Piscirickettsiaceae bacterium]
MSMLEQDRLRATLRVGHTAVRVLLIHPMSSGRSVNNSPAVSGLHFIQDIRCWRNDEPMLEVKCGSATAENPYFAFRLMEGEIGDKIKVRWVDNMGQKGVVETLVN